MKPHRSGKGIAPEAMLWLSWALLLCSFLFSPSLLMPSIQPSLITADRLWTELTPLLTADVTRGGKQGRKGCDKNKMVMSCSLFTTLKLHVYRSLLGEVYLSHTVSTYSAAIWLKLQPENWSYTVERQSKWRLYKRPTICAKISTIELLWFIVNH